VPSRRQVEQLARFGLVEEDAEAWDARGLPDDAFDDWLVDRVARRPSGARAPAVYGAEDAHDFARRALGELARAAGFTAVSVTNDGGGQLLTARAPAA
jgi:hypothetical protein